MYPNADPANDFIVRDIDGTNVLWFFNETKLGPKPTDSEIASNETSAENDAQKQVLQSQLDITDKKLPRALEDLIELLCTKLLINLNELPVSVQAVLASKKTLRNQRNAK
jgi:hypothetical protein